MCDVTEPEKGRKERGYVAKQQAKGRVFAAGFGDEDWARNAWLGEPFPFFAWWISVPESYDQNGQGLLHYTKIILNSKLF